MRQRIKKAKEESAKLRKAVSEELLKYMLAALGLVAGLAWNDAVKTLIEALFPLKENTVLAKFLYAVLITLVIAAFSMYLVRIFRKEESEIN